jgi:copper(I)-binding protein
MTIRQNIIAALLTITVLFSTSPVSAQDAAVTVTDAWTRASLVASRPGVLYLTLTNTGDAPLTLTGIETDAAAMAMIHRTTVSSDGSAGMEHAGPVTIAPGESVALEPGGLHGMLMNLAAPLNEGDTFKATLIFDGGATVDVTVPVLSATATGPQQGE